MELPKRHATSLHGQPFSVDVGWPVAAASRRPRPVCADGRPGSSALGSELELDRNHSSLINWAPSFGFC